MKRLGAAVLLSVMICPVVALAGSATKASADHAIASAQTKMKIAASNQDQWIATVDAFKAAKAAEQKGDFAIAEAEAKHAATLADLSIAQAKAQKKLWQNEIVH
ncbi:MAG: hypothetical protein PHT60_02530 [Acidiphilium sp.]|nr:hypothetical protein [Acidiphilium sp.]MDD4934632.1 hypothetical protein [Acidiphilium sp.]